MDVRLKKQEDNLLEMSNDKLTDSLIYNIIKKIELKMAMEQKYEEARTPQLKMIPQQFGRKLHSSTALGYIGLVMSFTLFQKFKAKKQLNLKSLIPHFLIALSINEYERYNNIMNFDQQLSNQFKSYQKNAKTIIEQKKSRVQLYEQFKKMNLVSFDKILHMLKYKPLY